MISYAVSTACFLDYEMTPVLADAFRKSKFRNIEVYLPFFTSDKPGIHAAKTRTLELIHQGIIRPVSAHLPFGGVWDVSSLQERRRHCAVLCLENMIRENAELLGPNLTLHSSSEPPMEEHPARIDQVCKSLEELIPLAEEFGFSFNIEYLPRTCIGHSVEEIQTITSRFNPEHVGICMDVNHVMDHAEALPEIIRTLTPRIRTFHISDYDNVDETHWVAGHGCIDWPAVMSQIRKIPQDVYLIHEVSFVHETWNHTIDPVWELRQLETATWFLENCDQLIPQIRAFKIPGNN